MSASLFAFLRRWRRTECPVCESRIWERDLYDLGCPHCGTWIEELDDA